ncbi:ribose-5-phosphate isomerase RpiA [Acuticoccus sp. M5D2P5]|uniref:ribose-5-phosphate isomerase RpiA n=1 Tax=Acuticoccus kalidii TaxID=2910977 RepID=UPI001F2957FE|nr:ribose-5-phosphate isomerase RpiA [Acuticoccus kalidii]MCF3935609.1 ribose-5-phosphate isomerase RpiA [Acuticoccus kalidii]
MSEAKRQVAEAAAAMVKPGMRLGLGSGSTALLYVEALGRRVASGLTLPPAIATSKATEEAARAAGIPLADMMSADAPTRLDLAVDGADEVDADLSAIKGGGACLLREKIAATIADRFVMIVDASKRVERLGRFPLPVEVVPFGWAAASAAIATGLGVTPVLRMAEGGPLVTDNGNYILDCPLEAIADARAVADLLSPIPGVVEHGLFVGLAEEVLIAGPEGVTRLTRTP